MKKATRHRVTIYETGHNLPVFWETSPRSTLSPTLISFLPRTDLAPSCRRRSYGRDEFNGIDEGIESMMSLEQYLSSGSRSLLLMYLLSSCKRVYLSVLLDNLVHVMS